ncbi:MAG: HipA domain-containing protein [Candidatus Berkiella sp.]
MSSSQENKLSVRLFGEEIGVLEQTQKARLHFTYRYGAQPLLSQSLPVKEKSFDHSRCFPYFAGLTPEGGRALPLLSRMLGVNQNDCFNLLKVMGMDCIGAVSFHELGAPIEETKTTPLKGEVLTQKDLEKKMQAMLNSPVFFNSEHVQVVLPGTHFKAAVCLIEGKVALPVQGHFSTHIFKPGIGIGQATILNEYFCMRIAKKLQLFVATVSLHKAINTNFLLVNRFDREVHGHKVTHIHQEDFCQARGILPTCKHQQEGGPSFKACFEIIENSNLPARDRNHLMKLIIFNYLISNYHAHGKDLSIQYLTPNEFQLTPFYDLQCSAVESNFTQMAMKVGGIYEHDEIRLEHWQKFCQHRGFGFLAFKSMMRQQIETILDIANEERKILFDSGFDCEVADKITKVIQKNCKLVSKYIYASPS